MITEVKYSNEIHKIILGNFFLFKNDADISKNSNMPRLSCDAQRFAINLFHKHVSLNSSIENPFMLPEKQLPFDVVFVIFFLFGQVFC